MGICGDLFVWLTLEEVKHITHTRANANTRAHVQATTLVRSLTHLHFVLKRANFTARTWLVADQKGKDDDDVDFCCGCFCVAVFVILNGAVCEFCKLVFYCL